MTRAHVALAKTWLVVATLCGCGVHDAASYSATLRLGWNVSTGESIGGGTSDVGISTSADGCVW